MDSLFFGESSNAFFAFDDFDRNRILMEAVYPPELYTLLGDPKIRIQRKVTGEIRLIGMDIATSGAKNADSTCMCVLSLIPGSNGQFIRSLIYIETMSGAHTYDQAVRLRQLSDDYQVDYVVIDTNGVGMKTCPPVRRRMGNKVRKKSGMLRCKSEWKACGKTQVTRNAYAMKLYLCRI